MSMYIYNQKFLVIGIAKSGLSVSKYLLEKNACCYVYDESTTDCVKSNLNLLKELGAIVVDKESVDSVLEQINTLVVSPGIPINHPICVSAKKQGKRIIGELEFSFLQFSPTIVGVTGTNGKTTTVSMINFVLERSKKKSVLVGNVGVPVLDELSKIDRETICVTEVSSFQLETTNSLCPHIACVLNIQPDHLERHYTMENYVFLKKRILKNLTKSEFAVLNYDDEVVKTFSNDTLAKIIYVSTKEKIFGAYLEDGWLTYNGERIILEEELQVKGIHNVYNALFSIAVLKLLGVSAEQISVGLKEFKGVKHRIELIAEHEGIKFYNDSKSTNSASTITALKAMTTPTVLILGGSDKGEDFSTLFNEIRIMGVKHTVLTGAVRYKMLSFAIKENLSDISVIEDFESAVKVATTIAKENQAVLLSPACASFDNFNNYAERGEKFKSIVENIIVNGQNL